MRVILISLTRCKFKLKKKIKDAYIEKVRGIITNANNYIKVVRLKT